MTFYIEVPTVNFSPDATTSYAYTVLRTGELYNVNYVLLSSYGSFALRIRTVPTMRILFALPMLSTMATTSMSVVPTDIRILLE